MPKRQGLCKFRSRATIYQIILDGRPNRLRRVLPPRGGPRGIHEAAGSSMTRIDAPVEAAAAKPAPRERCNISPIPTCAITRADHGLSSQPQGLAPGRDRTFEQPANFRRRCCRACVRDWSMQMPFSSAAIMAYVHPFAASSEPRGVIAAHDCRHEGFFSSFLFFSHSF